MSEEIRNQNPELNESALENVDGGGAEIEEKYYCGPCKESGCRCVGGSPMALYLYICTVGRSKIRSYRDCPFCKP